MYSKRRGIDLRCGDDDISVDELLVKLGVLALLVRGSYKSVALVLEPFADAELVLSSSEKFRDLEGGTDRVSGCSYNLAWPEKQIATIHNVFLI